MKTATPLADEKPFVPQQDTPPSIVVAADEPRRRLGSRRKPPVVLFAAGGGVLLLTLGISAVVWLASTLSNQNETDVADNSRHQETTNPIESPPTPTNPGVSNPISDNSQEPIEEPPSPAAADAEVSDGEETLREESTPEESSPDESKVAEKPPSESAEPIPDDADNAPASLLEVYSLRPPADWKQLATEYEGSPVRWQARFQWESGTQPTSVLSLVIERDAQYASATVPRVANRVLAPERQTAPIVYDAGAYIVPTAKIETVTLDGMPFVRAVNSADHPLVKISALLYAAYDHDRLIRIEGWEAGSANGDEGEFAALEAAAQTFRRLKNLSTVPVPAALATSETALPIPATELAKAEAVKSVELEDGEITALAASVGGKFIVWGSSEGRFHIYDREKDVKVETVRPFREQIDLVATQGQEFAWAISHRRGGMAKYNLQEYTPAWERFKFIKVMSGDQQSELATNQNQIWVTNVKSGNRNALMGHRQFVMAATISDDGTRVAHGSPEGSVYLWNLQGKSNFNQKTVHEGGTTRLALSPDKAWLASYGEDNQLIIWNVADSKAVHRLPDFGKVGAMRFLDNERLVVHHDDAVELWSVSDKPELEKKYEFPWSVGLANFTPDRSHVVAVKQGGTRFGDIQLLPMQE